ncbi:MAG: response regulator transcription factor [Oscillospiraceae bacterium]|nr:response regulator transcription factor [Oscillospiraceae bacterium]
METNKTVLIVDDEPGIVEILKFNLSREGYNTLAAYDGQSGLELALSARPDLILLDVMLPKMDGFDVCREIRKTSNVPIIMLTAREEENDKVLGLDLGADDYITKPFSVKELLARVKTNIRRSSAEAPQKQAPSASVTQIACFAIDNEKFEVYRSGVRLDLTLREYEIFKYLVTNAGRVCSREDMMRDIWKYDYYGDLRAVDVAVRRLREKLEENPAEPEYIITKRGIGYYFAG